MLPMCSTYTVLPTMRKLGIGGITITVFKIVHALYGTTKVFERTTRCKTQTPSVHTTV